MKKPSKRYFVYSHWLPTGELFYIGMGSSTRPFAVNDRTSRWHKIAKDPKRVIVRVIKKFNLRENAWGFEQQLIGKLLPRANVFGNPVNLAKMIKKRTAWLVSCGYYKRSKGQQNSKRRNAAKK